MTTLTINSRVHISDPFTGKQRLGTVLEIHPTTGFVRVAIDLAWMHVWISADACTPLDGVQNLVAEVAAYEQFIEAPLAWNAPTVPELTVLVPDTEDLIAINCLVEIKLPYQTPFQGLVEGVLTSTREVKVWKLNSPQSHWYSMDYARVIWTAEIAEEAFGLTAELETASL